MNMMRKKTQYVNITPIPSFIPRQLAIDFLHSHGEIIELNPLVTSHSPIKAPRDAPADEFYSTWYEISQRIQYIPGIGSLGSGAITFRGVFHDLPFGLQTHTYAPANVDLRNKWQICGNQPGEPPEPRELGSGAPPEGLYIREDVEIRCNVTMVNFVKKEMKAAAKIMVERLVKKAELLDSGALQALMENGRLKTINPADRSAHSPQPSPTMQYQMPLSPNRTSVFPSHSRHSSQASAHPAQQHAPPVPPKQLLGQNNAVMELPGDSAFYPQPPPPKSPAFLHPNANRASTASDPSQYSPSQQRWSTNSGSSASSRPSSYAPSEGGGGFGGTKGGMGGGNGMRSPGLEQKGFAAELPTMEETREEHGHGHHRGGSAQGELLGQQAYSYNPQDFARTQAPAYQAYGGQYAQR